MKTVKLAFALAVVMALSSCAATRTHMEQPPEKHVTLGGVNGLPDGCGEAGFGFERLLPDGMPERYTNDMGWLVPEGKLLVVTDVDWYYHHPDGQAAAGSRQVLELYIEPLDTGAPPRRAFASPVILNENGEGGISDTMTSGFVVAPGARICPGIIRGPLGPPSGLQFLMVRGYLVSD